MMATITKEDLTHDLSDLTYTPIVTLPVLDALLISLGLIEEYEAMVSLPSRRFGNKMYIRAASVLKERERIELERDYNFLYKDLLQKHAELKTKSRSKSKVTFVEAFGMCVPVNCLVGEFVPQMQKNCSPRCWHITQARLLDKFYAVEPRGGVYFLRHQIR